MSDYDSIDGKKKGSDETTFNGYDSLEISAAFQYACRNCDPKSALQYALEAYYSGGEQRMDIITKLFVVCLQDKGLANTCLFIQIFQLMVPLLTRKEDEKSFVEDDSPDEEWKKIKSHPGYKVSNLGKFKTPKGKLMIVTRKEKYNYVLIEGTYLRTDSLVAEAFLSKRSKLNFIQHIDGDFTDDSVTNLKWSNEEEDSEVKKKKNKKLPFRYFEEIDYDNLNENPDRLTYIYRFAMAVWMLAISPSSRTIAHSILLNDDISREVSEENAGSYSRDYGHPEQCRSYLLNALTEKNLRDCLYWVKILHYHPEAIEEKLKWTSIRKAYIYIWDAFKTVCEKAPNHISKYMDSMLSIGISSNWGKEDRSRLLYSYFIHMWCLDPIAVYVTNKDNTKKYHWGEHEFRGSFSYDFLQPGAGKKILGKWSNATTLKEDEELLFPLDYDVYFEPTSKKSLRYIDTKENKKKRFPDFEPYFKSIAEGKEELVIPEKLRKKATTLDKEINYSIINKLNLEREEEKWIPLSVFYGYLIFYDDSDMIESLSEKYGTIEEFFTKYNYPNPFVPKPNISKTEFISFRSTILKVLGLENEEKNKYTTMDPVEKRRLRSKSTFQYRTVPSPVGSKSPTSVSEVVVGKRISPLKREMSSPSTTTSVKSRVATARPEIKTPSYTKEYESGSEVIVKPRKKSIKK